MPRENFSSRLGFLLISAGCAIGLGNVWRFPYITGQYGGAAFVLIYLFFLLILGLPVMIMEFSVGRASQRSVARSFSLLEPAGTKWHWYSYIAMFGNYMLMMFYTTVCSWMVLYFLKMAGGEFVGKSPEAVRVIYTELLAQPLPMLICMIAVVLIGFGVCSMGLKNGVERITKVMMLCLLGILLVLVARAVTLDGAAEGLRFFLQPDFNRIREQGVATVIFTAMGQAFFTLSLGIGAMAIFGSYIGRDRSLTGESISITLLDTFVALMSGLIIFPACSAFNVNPDQGPGLVFVTLPNIFNAMPAGRIWGSLFFVFLTIAAFSSIIAVFENIVAFGIELFSWSRKKAVLINIFAIILLSLPCLLGFNLWSGFQPFGPGSTIQDLEDFIISGNILPIGSLVYLLFCTSRYGWGWNNFLSEANAGRGFKFPRWTRIYVSYILPPIILFIFIQGYLDKFGLIGRISALFA